MRAVPIDWPTQAREALVTAKREDTEAQQLAVAWREEYESVKHGAFKHGMNSLARSFRRLSVSTSDGFEGLQGLAEVSWGVGGLTVKNYNQ